MNVLVIGYGKIGKIKSYIWRELGATVTVYDTNEQKQEAAKTDGFLAYDKKSASYGIADISTPASYHAKTLAWVIQNIRPLPNILIEKPIVSSRSESVLLRSLLTEHNLINLHQHVKVNESYFCSNAVIELVKQLKKTKSPIRRVEIELSKNRLDDVLNGRFVDKELGVFGLELPHMIAILQAIGLSLNQITHDSVILFDDSGLNHNEGIELRLRSVDTEVVLRSFMGNYRIIDGLMVKNDRIIRNLKVSTHENSFEISFDPAEGLDRFMSRLKVCNRDRVVSNQELADDHLRTYLSQLLLDKLDVQTANLVSVDNSLEVADYIFSLMDQCENVNIGDLFNNNGRVVESKRQKNVIRS